MVYVLYFIIDHEISRGIILNFNTNDFYGYYSGVFNFYEFNDVCRISGAYFPSMKNDNKLLWKHRGKIAFFFFIF